MGCLASKAKLIDWVLGELPLGEEEELRRHVDQCADCAQELSGFQGVRDVLRVQLQDREMPAHLVFLPEKARELRLGFLAQLWRTAALAAVAAGVFLAIVLGGFARLGPLPLAALPPHKAALARAEVEAMVNQAVRLQWAQQKHELETINERLAANLRREQAHVLVPFAEQLQYLQSAQSVVWQETQKQNAYVELIARSSLGQGASPARRP